MRPNDSVKRETQLHSYRVRPINSITRFTQIGIPNSAPLIAKMLALQDLMP